MSSAANSDTWLTRFSERWVARAKTPSGMIAGAIAALFTMNAFAIGLEQGDPSHVVLLGSIFVFFFFWFLSWIGVGIFCNMWEAKTAPATPPFARPVPSNGSRSSFRIDEHAGFWTDRGGFLFRRRVWFIATGCPPVEVAGPRYEFLIARQTSLPVRVAAGRYRSWWWFEGRFYWENEGYDSEDVMALVRQRQRAKERKLQHARALLTAEDEGLRKREGIPLDVRRAVWARDGGRCVECGRAEVLELDHVIPLALGGSNTEKNLQLLCADCNRMKGATL